MKVILAGLTLGLVSHLNAQILTDSFADTTVDSNLWESLPRFPSSSVVEGGGGVSFTNRGQILTKATFGNNIVISGTFSIQGNPRDQFSIYTRTDGVSTNIYKEFDNNIRYSVTSLFDNGSVANNIEIKAIQGSAELITGVTATLPIAIGVSYTFRIVDDGLNTAFFINDMITPIVSLTFAQSFGGKVAFGNREGTDGGSSFSEGSVTILSDVQISSIPEPASFAAIAGVLIFGTVITARPSRRKGKI